MLDECHLRQETADSREVGVLCRPCALSSFKLRCQQGKHITFTAGSHAGHRGFWWIKPGLQAWRSPSAMGWQCIHERCPVDMHAFSLATWLILIICHGSFSRPLPSSSFRSHHMSGKKCKGFWRKLVCVVVGNCSTLVWNAITVRTGFFIQRRETVNKLGWVDLEPEVYRENFLSFNVREKESSHTKQCVQGLVCAHATKPFYQHPVPVLLPSPEINGVIFFRLWFNPGAASVNLSVSNSHKIISYNTFPVDSRFDLIFFFIKGPVILRIKNLPPLGVRTLS